MKNKYPVATLCGSVKYKDEFLELERELTLNGNIVISLGLFGHSEDEEVWSEMDESTNKKTRIMLGDMHRQKIDMADEIYVINPKGYIGENTWSEICYATMIDKRINFLSSVDFNEIDDKVNKHISMAEELAYKQYDILTNKAGYLQFNSLLKSMVTIKKRYYSTVDPWIPDDINTAIVDYPYPGHGDKEKGFDPFAIYGKTKMAKFVEEIIGPRM